MRMPSIVEASATITMISAGLGLGMPTAGAGELKASQKRSSSGEHCISNALSAAEMEAGVISDFECFDEFSDVARRLGYAGPDVESVTPTEFFTEPQYATAASSVLARHLDYPSGNPDSLTITGGACNGGGLNLSAAWNNRIDATQHVTCGTIKHYSGSNYTGTLEQTVGAQNQLVFLQNIANQVTSIKYY